MDVTNTGNGERGTGNGEPVIETRQVAGLDITLATPRKVSFDSHHECRNINRSRNDSPTPPVCSLQSAFCTHLIIVKRLTFFSLKIIAFQNMFN